MSASWGELLLGWGELVVWSFSRDNFSDALIVYHSEPFWDISTVFDTRCGPGSSGDSFIVFWLRQTCPARLRSYRGAVRANVLAFGGTGCTVVSPPGQRTMTSRGEVRSDQPKNTAAVDWP